MKSQIHYYSIQKAGNSSDENDDAFLTVENSADIDDPLRVAVSDGATESSYSKEWAHLLVTYFDFFLFDNKYFWKNIFPAVRKSWLERISSKELPWYAEQKLELGAFASFLGAQIQLKKNVMTISAIGDSNCFLIRGNQMKLSFPIAYSKDFGNTPFLISSVLEKNKIEDNAFKELHTDIQSGDIIYLATDAISQWFLFNVEQDQQPWEILKELFEMDNSNEAFSMWIDKLRSTSQIKNDDITVIQILLL